MHSFIQVFYLFRFLSGAGRLLLPPPATFRPASVSSIQGKLHWLLFV